MKLLAGLVQAVKYMKRQTVYVERKAGDCIDIRLKGIKNCWEEETLGKVK